MIKSSCKLPIPSLKISVGPNSASTNATDRIATFGWHPLTLTQRLPEESEVAVDVHALVQDAHDVDDAFGADPIEQRV